MKIDTVDGNDVKNNEGDTTSENTNRARRNNHNSQTKKNVERQSGAELEIKLLKKEISSLNEELHDKTEKFKHNLERTL